MKDVYKMTVRFDLTDARERYLAEYMQTPDVKKYQSRNQFVLDAIADYVDLQSITREQHDEDIRSIIREEMRACFAEANFAPQPMTNAPALTAEQQKEAEQEILWTTLNCLIDGTMTANFKTDIKIDGKMPSYQDSIIINSIRHSRTVEINTPWLCLIL